MLIFWLMILTSSTSFAQTSHSPNYDSLRRVLEMMVDKDQEIRRILVDSIGIESPLASQYIKRMMVIDEDNQEKIKLILGRYGWIAQSKIGVKAAQAFFFTIQHSDTALMEKWFQEFKRLAEAGEADKAECAMMEDRLLMWHGKKQKYGTQASIFREDLKLAIWPIEEPATVNERRMKMGFGLTVEENAIRLKAIYNPNESLPKKKK